LRGQGEGKMEHTESSKLGRSNGETKEIRLETELATGSGQTISAEPVKKKTTKEKKKKEKQPLKRANRESRQHTSMNRPKITT